ncbi:MAG TPA: tetratricopeptide repeat protein [Candidatus Sulfotelmatobacter sp.]|nr:tetratricopeptide repeat protein [Candidatus Sulfotelmatobacter sp.]
MRRLYYLLLFIIMLTGIAEALPFRSEINRGNDLYKRGLFDQAEKKYDLALKKRTDKRALYDLGDALYQQAKYAESEKTFGLLTAEAQNSKLREAALYNLGNAQFRQENYEGAVRSYEEALKIIPNDEDARYNLELAKKMLKMPKQKRPKQDRNQKDKEKEKDKDKAQKPQPQQNKQGLSKEDAERILQGISGNEKHKAKLAKGKGGNNDKDW